MNRKKAVFRMFAAMVFLLLITFGTCNVYAAENKVTSDDIAPELLLNRIGISTSYGDGSYISRGDFAVMAVMASGDVVLTDKERFSDVAGEQGRYINTAAELGYVAVGEDRLFSPDNIITTEEAVTICLRILGYENIMKDVSYPDGYMNKGIVVGLAKNLSKGQLLTWNEAEEMIYNMLTAKYVATSYPISSTKTEYVMSDEPYMTYAFDIVERRGVITSVCGLTLNGENSTDGSHIIINNTKYDNPYYCNSSDYINIGRNVVFYTRKTSADTTEVIYMYSYGEVLDIDTYDINEVVGFNIGDSSDSKRSPNVSYTDKNGKSTRKISISPTASIFINGVSCVDVKNEDFTYENGIVYLTDRDDDNIYDVVSIEKYMYYKVKSYDGYERVLSDDYGKTPIRLSDFNKKLISIVSGGVNTDDSVITVDSMIEVMCSFKADGNIDTKKFIRLRLMSGVVKGTIDAVSDEYYYIDGKPYRAIPYLKPELNKRLGHTGEFCLANENLIICCKNFVSKDATNYGYLVNVGTKSQMKKEYQFRIYTLQAKMIDVYASKELKFIGERNGAYKTGYPLKEKDITEMIAAGKLNPQMIKYELDDDGKLAVLQTAIDHTGDANYIGYDNDHFSLDYKCVQSDGIDRYDQYLENGYLFNNRTICIYVTDGSTSEEGFDIGKYALRGGSKNNLEMEIYDTADNLTVQYAVLKNISDASNGGGGSLYFNTSMTWLIGKKTYALNDDGNFGVKLSVMRGDLPGELVAVNDDLAPVNANYGGARYEFVDGALTSTGEYGVPTTINKFSELEPGDIISVMTNSRGQVAGYVVMNENDSSKPETDETYQAKDTDNEKRPWLSDFRRIKGMVTEFNPDSAMKVDVTGDTRLCIGRSVPIYMIYYTGSRTIEVPKDKMTLNVGDYVWVYMNKTDVKMVVKYVDE